MCQELAVNLTNSRYVMFVNVLMSYIDLELLKVSHLFLALNKTETKLARSFKSSILINTQSIYCE